MLSLTDAEIFKRLLLITLLAGVVGFERERHGRAAGFRTHILVGIGSCLVMLTGIYLMDDLAGRAEIDPTRLAAQVISGIGFLGAGTILRFRASVLGLTTAASLWATAGIGVAVGAGFLSGAVASTLIVIVALYGFSRLERAMRQTWYQTLVVEASASDEKLSAIREVLAAYDVEIRDFDIKQSDGPGRSRIELSVKLLNHQHREEILQDLQSKGTAKAYWL
ncbi:MAG: MgtC/SapB family protein [Candidatus Omnitrophota bacterium]|nr:MgtC/SapB family protein [Candidatus Omnitrophota bacterium]